RDNLKEMSATHKSRMQLVLWTDVPRADFNRAAAPSDTWDSPRLADVNDMLKWAAKNNVFVVNVDEVFNAESPMLLHEFYKAESAKQAGPGYAAASDILRLEILYRFGGVYMDGDNLYRDPSSLAQVVSSREGYAIDATRDGVGNSVLAMPMNHPFAAVYLDEIKNRYSKNQYDLLFSWRSKKENFFKGLYGTVRRNSVMQRTGPDMLDDLAERIGIDISDFPCLPGVIVRSDHTWLDKPARASQGGSVPRRQRTLPTAQLLIQSLVRDLYNRVGDLHLTAADQAVHGHPQRDLLWEAALAFIAEQPGLASKVKSVTLYRNDFFGEQHVQLPHAADALLDFTTPAGEGNNTTQWLGEHLTPVRLRTPLPPDTPRQAPGAM
ncbi:TcdA/TcdB catalytic glycosyltransferase domain-containing protein, partial [Streptomyces sp. NPDC019531]|uniref:TcdA/TcdB catalytic glycosyltransferase domain-containing protein n=1 Tax=Streptomyces sp. NPDC019531 TaxID=3365062 RepID=UPI00384BEEEA